MKQYIDKSALVAEIEKKRDAALTRQRNLESIGQVTVLNETLARELSRIISFIDTLEVKEVQEEPVSEDSHIKKSQEESCKENGDSLTCDDLERKAVGVGLRFRDELICDGVSREAAEIYAAIAQQKFMDGAKWQKEKLIEKACKFIRTPCIYVVDFNHYGGATTNYEATVEKFRKYMEE